MSCRGPKLTFAERCQRGHNRQTRRRGHRGGYNLSLFTRAFDPIGLVGRWYWRCVHRRQRAGASALVWHRDRIGVRRQYRARTPAIRRQEPRAQYRARRLLLPAILTAFGEMGQCRFHKPGEIRDSGCRLGQIFLRGATQSGRYSCRITNA